MTMNNAAIQQNPTHRGYSMHPANIKAALQIAGSSQKQIAIECEVSETAVNHVIWGRSTSRPIAEAISKKTGKPLSELWPGRYDQPSKRARN
jgi:lambda repressor-like predicted transcriptional regulator